MKIVVNDTNVFIDLLSVDLLEQFFQLSIEVHTTDLIVDEFTRFEQRNIIDKLLEEGRIKVKSFDFSELVAINALYKEIPKLSIPDCSILHYSKSNKYTLITGDGPLRNWASGIGVDVKGILFVFDEMVKNNLIDAKVAATKLKMLVSGGTRLPSELVKTRLKKWNS